jgi:hypothetical protein
MVRMGRNGFVVDVPEHFKDLYIKDGYEVIKDYVEYIKSYNEMVNQIKVITLDDLNIPNDKSKKAEEALEYTPGMIFEKIEVIDIADDNHLIRETVNLNDVNVKVKKKKKC